MTHIVDIKQFIPSKYQVKVFDFVQFGSGNLIISAVAGSGKTTTIIKCLEFIPKHHKAIFVAFNKSIVEELSGRLKHLDNVVVKTVHSVGISAINKAYNKPQLNERKVKVIIDQLKITWTDVKPEDMAEVLDNVRALTDLARVNVCKTPNEIRNVAEKYDIDILNGEVEKVIEVIKVARNKKDEIDFTDMIYFPCVDDSIKFYQYDWVFTDECQDLNIAQQTIVKKLLRAGGRAVYVGDNYQSIYGFSGADAEAFNKLRSIPNTTELPLSCTYRCGKSIVNYVKRSFSFLSHLEAFEGAAEGAVNEKASIKNIEEGSFILCRNTLPLVKCCLEFLASGKKAYIKGADIGMNLIKLIDKSETDDPEKFSKWSKQELNKVVLKLMARFPGISQMECEENQSYIILQEKLNVIELIRIENKCDSMQKTIASIRKIFDNEKEGYMFCTMHKSKGLEADHVYILPPIPSKRKLKNWERQQEDNLLYVAWTRGKKSLNFIADWDFKMN